MGDRLWAGIPPRYVTNSAWPSLPGWTGTMSTGDGIGHRWGRNSEFYVAVGPVTRTAGILI